MPVCVLLCAWLPGAAGGSIVDPCDSGGSGDAVAWGHTAVVWPWRDSWRGPKTWNLLGTFVNAKGVDVRGEITDEGMSNLTAVKGGF